MKDNTPAFPFPAYTYPNGEINHGEGGMTLRDYFAAKSLDVAQHQCKDFYGIDKQDVAKWCYGMADAMMEARK